MRCPPARPPSSLCLLALTPGASRPPVRKYHRDYYRPDNLCCVVVGTVPEAELLGSLAKIQAKIVSKGPLHPQQRCVAPLPAPLHTTISSGDHTCGIKSVQAVGQLAADPAADGVGDRDRRVP